MRVRLDYANKLLGLKLSEAQVIESLRRSRLDARVTSKEIVEVAIPTYRIDVLHEVDLVEEIAIGYGYYKLKPTIPQRSTIGEQHPAQRTANKVRQLMIGLDFTEVVNFTLTNEITHYERMRTKADDTIKLANPVSLECTILRQSLLPSLMKNLMDNKHESFPQRLFEVSDVGRINQRVETRTERRLHVAGVSSHPAANFTEIKSTVEALLHNMSQKGWKIRPLKHLSFLEGRAAAVVMKQRETGVLGEIHPEVLNNFELENPACAFEIDIEEA
jgi:phenylalanyl-tRNA synthetase beta chain